MNPALRGFLANQYQAILLAGAAAFSVVTWSPLPLLLLLGGELVALPFGLEKLRKRLEIEGKHAARQRVDVVSQEEQFRELPAESAARFVRLRQLCQQVQHNYRGLSPASQGMLHDQTAKFDAILVSCLRRLWLLRKYDDLIRTFDADVVASELEQLETDLAGVEDNVRVREAWEQNAAIKRKLLESADRNRGNRQALVAELDSLESLLHLLLQKSVAATDADAFVSALDDALRQAEADAASVEEMEQAVGVLPDSHGQRLSDSLRTIAVPRSAAPPLPTGSDPPRARPERTRR